MQLFKISKEKNEVQSYLTMPFKDFKEIDNTNDINKFEFFDIIHEVTSNEIVQKMKNYRQHCDTSCYEHCLHVAYYTYVVCKKLKLDYVSATRAAMLHDLFLYDWRKKYRNVELPGLHAFVHPKIALKNASIIFPLNAKERDIIEKHMWPLTISLPRYKESYIVTLMDKYSAFYESYLYFQSQLKKNRIYKYAYVFLSLVLFRII